MLRGETDLHFWSFLKGFLARCLFVVFAFHSYSSFAAEPHDATSWLIAQFRTMSYLQIVNAGNVAGLRECACYELMKQGKSIAACEDLKLDPEKEPTYVHEIIRFVDGAKYQDKSLCGAALERFVFKPIAIRYPDMVRDMVLMQPQHRVDDLRISQSTPTHETLDYFISTHPAHPLHGSVWQPFFKPAKITLSDDDIGYYQGLYTSEVQKKCLEYFGNEKQQQYLQQAESYFVPRISLGPKNVCDFLTYGVPLEKDARSIRTTLDPIFSEYYRWLKAETEGEDGFRTKRRKSYFRNANGNPLLLLVSSAHPNLEEVATGLKYIEGNALDRMAKAKRQSERLEKRLKTMSGQVYLSKKYVKTQLIEYADMENGYWSTRSILKDAKWSDEEIASAQEEALGWSRMARLESGAVQAAVLTTAIYLCVTAPEAAVALQWGCWGALALPANFAILGTALIDYDHFIRDFFMGTEPYQALQKLQKYEDRDAAIRFAALMLPIAMFPKKAMEAMQAAKISKGW